MNSRCAVNIETMLRKHALPDPHDEREVMHAPLLKDAADEIESLRQQLARAEAYNKVLEEEVFEAEKDVARYRWLRTQNPRQYQKLWNYCLNSDVMFDDQVDECMGEQHGKD